MKTNYLLSLLLMNFILFCFAIVENKAQTIKKDPVSGTYQIQANPQIRKLGKNLTASKFNRKTFDKQFNKLNKISKLHTMFESINKAQLKADSIRTVKQNLHVPQLERAKLLGKLTPFYKAPFVPKPNNTNSSDNSLVSNVLINGKAHDTVNVGDPFSLTFSLAEGSITAVINVYFDSDNNGIVSPGDLKLESGLVMDNSDYDADPGVGTYKMNFSKENGYSNFVTSLIFEVNDYHSVSSAVLTVKQKPASSIILGALNVPFKNIIVAIGNYSSNTYILTDSAGKFAANVDRSLVNQVSVHVFDQFGSSNGYIPPSTQYFNITSDTTRMNLSYTVANSFIDGYAKDQYGAPIKNVRIEADGYDSGFYTITQTDSLGYYKVGVNLGTWYIYPSVPWTNDYIRSTYSQSIYVNQAGTVHQDLLFLKSNCTISGIVSYNSNGIEGLPVYAYSDTVNNFILTTQNGNYSIPVFKPASGTIFYDVNASVAPGYYMVSPDWQGVPPAQNVNFQFIKIAGGVQGIVTDSKTGKPIYDACISFQGTSNKSVYSVEDGSYRASLLDGQYSIYVDANYYNSWTMSSVQIAGSMINLNIALVRSGSISGTIKDEDGKPLYDAYINIMDTLGFQAMSSYSDMQGNYVVSPLISSKYKAYVSRNGFIAQWYNNVSSYDSASIISVTEGYDTPNINFVLSKGGTISGKVVDKLGKAIPGVEVDVYDSLYSYGNYGITDSSGGYTVTGLKSGKYYVRTYSQFYIDQWYDGVADQDKAKLVSVLIYQNTPNINFTLSRGSAISGFVKDKYNNSISYPTVVLLDSLFNLVIYGNGDNVGNYYINKLLPYKKYYVSAVANGYSQRWYDNVSVPDSATPIILLPEESRNNINFNLPSAGSVSGRVLDNLGLPVSYIDVLVQDSLGYYYNYGFTDNQGNYSVLNLSSGKYYASVNDNYHAEQWFDHKTSRQQADLIKVVEDQVTQNINFDLIKPSSDSVIIKLKLENIPDTLRFSQNFVPDSYSDYWWGVCFDVDGDINTGTNGCEIEIALYHGKYSGDSAFVSNIIDATNHILINWASGYVEHSDVDVQIDPADKNTLLLKAPKYWAEISQITSKTRYYAHTGYYSNNGWVSDYTGVGKDMVTITDPVGDVSYDFVDIVSAGWNIKIIDNIPASDYRPVDFKLEQNYPNPFNPSTKIRYALPDQSCVKIIVYNLLGQVVREVVNEVQQAGYHEVNFSADNLSSGVYFYSIVANSTSNRQDFKSVKKMLLLK